MSRRLRPIGLACLVIACGALAGCSEGGGDTIPTQTAGALVRDIDTVEDRVREGECRKARPALRRLDGTAKGLPDDVDAELRSTLTDGVARLSNLVQTQCRQKKPKPEPVVEPEPTYVAPPVQTAPEPEPTPEPPTAEEPQQEEPEEDPPVERSPDEEEPAPEERPTKRRLKGDGRPSCRPGLPEPC